MQQRALPSYVTLSVIISIHFQYSKCWFWYCNRCSQWLDYSGDSPQGDKTRAAARSDGDSVQGESTRANLNFDHAIAGRFTMSKQTYNDKIYRQVKGHFRDKIFRQVKEYIFVTRYFGKWKGTFSWQDISASERGHFRDEIFRQVKETFPWQDISASERIFVTRYSGKWKGTFPWQDVSACAQREHSRNAFARTRDAPPW